MIMPSITAAILLLTFCSWARAVPACVRGTAPTQATWAAQALTSAAHTAESSSSSDLPAISEKIATSAAQVSNIAATTRQVTLTKATAVSLGKASSAAPPVSATGTGSSSSKMGVSWPVQEKDASPIAQFFVPTSTVSWWFDWNKNWNQSILSADGVSISGQFIPMLFANGQWSLLIHRSGDCRRNFNLQ
ncbi:hypothetical protein L804_04559 [Cryptococcus deuterogattii 2001/935-1]|nr:hypothetical protein L804_04559 [Cryptococcus deuterogattii 2001/935-1]